MRALLEARCKNHSPNFTKFSVLVNCGRGLGSVRIWQQCNKLCTSGLWMTSCLPIIGHAKATPTGRIYLVTRHGRIGGKVWCRRLPCFCVGLSPNLKEVWLNLCRVGRKTLVNYSILAILVHLLGVENVDLLTVILDLLNMHVLGLCHFVGI